MAKTVTANNQTHIPLRAGNDVMRLARMGSFHQSRLSFMRVLLRRLKSENWTFTRPIWDIDANGVGVATYSAIGPQRTYTLVAFAHDLPDELRSDRVIAEAWDATFSLHDGDVSKADIERLKQNVPLQEAGRISDDELVLSRANKSVRLFDYVRDCLAAGTQPDLAKIEPIGYLMRTSAVYGSGKFGAADRHAWADRPEFAGSFQPELLAVWLIRAFTIDMVEHMAKIQQPDTAVTLAPDIRRRFGVGNSTGLGMAPFLINHPALIHAWINARETALGRVRAIASTDTVTLAHFISLVKRAAINADAWQVEHPYQNSKTEGLRTDLSSLTAYMQTFDSDQAYPWDVIYLWGTDNLTIEGQEQLVSLLIEPFGDLVDDLASTMSADETTRHIIDGTQTIAAFRELITTQYGWAGTLDFSQKAEQARVWYVSQEKLEPRLGERFEEPIAPYEQPLAPGRDVIACYEAMKDWGDNDTLATFLMAHPEHRHIVRRAQLINGLDYAEIRDNTIAANMMPIDLLRCKLSFFGATKFDPRSDRWLRITMYQGAPFPEELENLDPDDLVYPPLQ
ncbi:hypothetical protein [Candidatus Puniceispirillum marinum]|uniref:Uncharacterized protein n=1 Tax=Puniceispirillum marinum (strain IMCC1322) TaxID=488538 RepID=D5BRU8_PUNMI|nr:hypothetical protein [Candidatus Puniceispirillum marinum]ADE38995.1 hypothetical protein SAR116_0752 [Candidatus Puniceispirillum marinum IMCC1322]